MCGLRKKLAFGAAVTLLMSLTAAAQLPPTIPLVPSPTLPKAGKDSGNLDELRAKMASRLAMKDTASGDETSIERKILLARLTDLLDRLGKAPSPSPNPIPSKQSTPPKTTPELLPDLAAVNPIRKAMNYFRDNDFVSALGSFRQIDVSPLTSDERAFVLYMRASCERRLNNINAAAIGYREVADANLDEFTTECAVWQLSMLRSAQELQVQLEQIRARTKSR